MRKKSLLLGIMAIFAAISLSVTSCSKDKSDAAADITNKNYTIGDSDMALEITTNCAGVYERYQYVTPGYGDTCWRWKRNEYDEFIFDIDMQWELPEVAGVEMLTDNSFKVFYADGTDVQISNVSSDGNFTSTQIMANNDSAMTVNFTFPFDLNLMDAVNYCAMYGIEGADDIPFSLSIPWSVVGSVFVRAISSYGDMMLANCETDARIHAYQCSSQGCLLTKIGCNVTCENNTAPGGSGNYNCSQHNYAGF